MNMNMNIADKLRNATYPKIDNKHKEQVRSDRREIHEMFAEANKKRNLDKHSLHLDGTSGLQFPKKESHKTPNWGSGPRVPEKGPLKISKYGKIDGSIASELTKEQRAKLGIKTKPSIEVGKSTKLYSSLYSGTDILDELLERAFCDGYEYAQREFNSKSQKAMRKALEIAEAKKNMKVPEFISSEFKTIKNPEYEKALNKEIGRVRWNARIKNDELGTINRSINNKAVFRKSIGYNDAGVTAKMARRYKDKGRQKYRDHGVFAEDPDWIASSNRHVTKIIRDRRN